MEQTLGYLLKSKADYALKTFDDPALAQGLANMVFHSEVMPKDYVNQLVGYVRKSTEGSDVTPLSSKEVSYWIAKSIAMGPTKDPVAKAKEAKLFMGFLASASGIPSSVKEEITAFLTRKTQNATQLSRQKPSGSNGTSIDNSKPGVEARVKEIEKKLKEIDDREVAKGNRPKSKPGDNMFSRNSPEERALYKEMSSLMNPNPAPRAPRNNFPKTREQPAVSHPAPKSNPANNVQLHMKRPLTLNNEDRGEGPQKSKGLVTRMMDKFRGKKAAQVIRVAHIVEALTNAGQHAQAVNVIHKADRLGLPRIATLSLLSMVKTSYRLALVR